MRRPAHIAAPNSSQHASQVNRQPTVPCPSFCWWLPFLVSALSFLEPLSLSLQCSCSWSCCSHPPLPLSPPPVFRFLPPHSGVPALRPMSSSLYTMMLTEKIITRGGFEKLKLI